MKNNEQKEYTEGIKVSGGFFGWLENFWYHYKWHTVGILAALIVVTVCTLQMCEKEDNDTLIVYAGSANLSESEADSISKALGNAVPYDFDGDGKKSIALQNYLIWNKDQIEELEAETNEDGKHQSVNRSYISEQKAAYDKYLLTGESSIYILESDLYAALKAEDRLLPVSDISEELSEYSADGFGIKLSELPIYEKYKVLAKLPEDTMICILRPYVVGKSSKEKAYNFEKDMFEAIVEFGREDT